MTETLQVALIAASAAVFGGLVGGMAAVLAAYLQQRAETRRDLVRMAAELELEMTKAWFATATSNVQLSLDPGQEKAIVNNFRLLTALADHGAESSQVRRLLEDIDAMRAESKSKK